jgi:hypothetical protein
VIRARPLSALFILSAIAGGLRNICADTPAERTRQDVVLKTHVGEVDVQIFIPRVDGPVRGLIVHAANYGLKADDRWAELCRQIKFAHVAMNIPNVQRATGRHQKLSKALGEGLKEFAVTSGRAELMGLPLIGTGHSAGGLVTGVLLKDPARTITNCIDCSWVMDSTKLSPEAARVPALFTMGAIPDAFKMLDAIDQHFYPARQKNLPWGLGVQWACAHDFGNSATLMFAWIDAMVRMRMAGDSGTLQDVKLEEGWLGDPSSVSGTWATVAPYAQYPGERAKAAWFPNRAVAWTWRAWQAKDSPGGLRARADEAALPDWSAKRAMDLMADAGAEITLSVRTERPLKRVRYFDGDVLIGEGAGEGWKLAWRNAARGCHVVHAQWDNEAGKPGAANPALIIVPERK